MRLISTANGHLGQAIIVALLKKTLADQIIAATSCSVRRRVVPAPRIDLR